MVSFLLTFPPDVHDIFFCSPCLLYDSSISSFFAWYFWLYSARTASYTTSRTSYYFLPSSVVNSTHNGVLHYPQSLVFPCSQRQAKKTKNQIPWPEFADELYRPSDHRLSVKVLRIEGFAWSARRTRIFSIFLERSRYFSFQVTSQFCSWGWVDPVPDPILLRKSGNAGNRTLTFGFVAMISDH
jgi:hypothetical protein